MCEGRSRDFLEHSKWSALLFLIHPSSFSRLCHLSTYGHGLRCLGELLHYILASWPEPPRPSWITPADQHVPLSSATAAIYLYCSSRTVKSTKAGDESETETESWIKFGEFPGFSRYWADDLVSWILHWMPRRGFLTCFHQGCRWKWWLLMMWYSRMIWLPWEEKDAGSSFFHMEYIVVLVPWTKSMIKLGVTCLHFARQDLQVIYASRDFDPKCEREVTGHVPRDNVWVQRQENDVQSHAAEELWCFFMLFFLFGKPYSVVFMKNLNTFDATYVCMFQPKQLEPWRLVICSQSLGLARRIAHNID